MKHVPALLWYTLMSKHLIQIMEHIFIYLNSKDAYLFCYINALNMMQSNNDIPLIQFENHFKTIMKTGLMTKKAIISDHFNV